eukprot:gene15673-21199_t
MSNSSSNSGEQLISFFLYSLFIYPVTNYIISPKRGLPKWKSALYAMLFLAAVTIIHMMYENSEKGPNHYQLLNVTRDSSISTIKKAYRNLSLELHPDKNKASTASEEFQKVKHAFDVLVNKDKRREYNRLGDHGVAVSAQTAIDLKYIILQLVIYYSSSLIFAFLMTFSEPSGDAFSLSVFGLFTMLLVESLLVVKEIDLPSWILPYHAPSDIVSTLHRLFPAFMNGCRCITGAYYIDRKAVIVLELEALANSTREANLILGSVCQSVQDITSSNSIQNSDSVSDLLDTGNGSSTGFMAQTMSNIKRRVAVTREYKNGDIKKNMNARLVKLSIPTRTGVDAHVIGGNGKNDDSFLIIARNIVLYLFARFMFVKSRGE